MRTLLIDNYDSFTFNLFQLLFRLTGEEPIVVKNDQLDWSDICKFQFSNVVISPGPGRPDKARDFGISASAILDGRWPVLGVCLGHQGICQLFGAEIVHAPEPMHGRLSDIYHTGEDLFRGLPSPFQAVRYHSLIAINLPDALLRLAWTEDNIVMAVRHVDRPVWGVQFHPESICSEQGSRLLANFLDLSSASWKNSASVEPRWPLSASTKLKVFSRQLPIWISPEDVFVGLFSKSDPSFWLDSSAVIPGVSRFSFMGDSLGPFCEHISYSVADRRVRINRGDDRTVESMSIFDYLDVRLRALRTEPAEEVPFDFSPGYVGYLAYEMKAETGGSLAHSSTHPDAQFLFVDRIVCFDHQEKKIWLVCCDERGRADRATLWLDSCSERLAELAVSFGALEPNSAGVMGRLEYRHSSDRYFELIDRCLQKIRCGESYEICLTNQITAFSELDSLRVYLTLRKANPAPYSAFLRFGDIDILCSSPERFVRFGASGEVESKPIKGTIRRGNDVYEDNRLRDELQHSTKERAENLMIVDLIRNDLARFCSADSVCVSSLFSIETYATLHQLVSTVRGALRPDRSVIDGVRALFPGGSMTGAPKVRTMEIIDELEGGPRGIYSGSIGYLSIAGTADLNIVIRTIVLHSQRLSIGVGGAITFLSDSAAELEEAQLKAVALLTSLAAATGCNSLDDL